MVHSLATLEGMQARLIQHSVPLYFSTFCDHRADSWNTDIKLNTDFMWKMTVRLTAIFRTSSLKDSNADLYFGDLDLKFRLQDFLYWLHKLVSLTSSWKIPV